MADKSEDSKVLTKEIAEQFLADPDSVNLREFTAIDDDAARILAKKFHDGLDIASLSENVRAKLGSCKLLVDYSYYTGEIDLCGLFITSIGDFRKCEGKSYTLVNHHEGYEVDFDKLLSIRSRDQDLIAKLQAEYGGGELLLGDHIIRNQIDKVSGDDDPRPELVDPPGTITNSVGMKLVSIPAGSFMMGSPKKEKDSNENEQQHKVTLTKDFYLGMTQVTQAQYKKVMRKNPSYFQGDEVSGRDSSEFPVETVSWDDAVKFCKKLSSLPEEKKAGRVYRLPTEAEWEYACRAGSTTAFSFGKSSKSLGDYGWYDDNSGNRPHPVALKKPNAWGLYDMHGNVWEWCSDWCDDYPEVAVSDPTGPEEGSSRVYRGGCWYYEAAYCRSAYRRWVTPVSRCSILGFRVALVQVATAELKSSTGAGGQE